MAEACEMQHGFILIGFRTIIKSEVGGWGESQREIVLFRFVSFVRSCARSGCLVEFDPKSWRPPFPFPFLLWQAFPLISPYTPELPIQLLFGLSK